MNESQFQYNIHGLLNLSAGLFNLSVGTIVLLQRKEARINQSFFLVTFVAFLWMTGFGFLSLSTNEEGSYLWARIAYLGIPLISPAVFLFSENWTKGRSTVLSRIGFVTGGAMTIAPLLSPRKLLKLVDHSWGRYVQVESSVSVRLYYVFLFILFIFFGTLAMRNFYAGWKGARDPIRRVQFRSVFFAFVIAYLGSVDFAVKLGLDYYPSGCVWLSCLVAYIAYTILRHRTMDIDLIRNRISLLALIYSALIALALPIVVPISRELMIDLGPHGAIDVTILVIGGGLFLSVGPMIFAYMVGQQFWLKSHVTSALTHELKSPIGAIRGVTELLRNASRKSNKRAEDYLSMLERNTDRLEGYVSSLLTVLKLRENQLTARRVPCDLRDIIRRSVRNFLDIATNKGLTISMIPTPCPELIVDREGIYQVVSNLLSNATKFSDQGTITISTALERNEVLVTVADEGRGIAANELPRIFDQFYQGAGSVRGSGLGLAIAKGWVEAHGGRIWAETSHNAKGTRVSFSLPL